MAQSVFSSPIKKLYGETVSLTTTAQHLAYRPHYHEVMFYCATAWRMGIAPRLARVKFYDGTTYTDYTAQATDGDSGTHVPLDGMTTSQYLYVGLTERARGLYFDIGSNPNSINTALDMEYHKEISLTIFATSDGGTKTKITSTAHGLLDGDIITITGTISYNGVFTIEQKQTNDFVIPQAFVADDATGKGRAFDDVESDSDLTDASSGTLAQDGLFSFTLPTVVRAIIPVLDSRPLYWYRFKPGATLRDPTDINEIIPATEDTNYAYMVAGVNYQFALNLAQSGAFEFDHTASDTLNVSWIQH